MHTNTRTSVGTTCIGGGGGGGVMLILEKFLSFKKGAPGANKGA